MALGVWQFAGSVATAIPTLWLAKRLFEVWRDPLRYDDGKWVRYGVGLFLIEFLVVHSGTALGSILRKQVDTGDGLLAAAGVGLLYTVFAAAIAAGIGSGQLLVSFLTLLAGRTLGAALFLTRGEVDWLMAHSVVSVVLYLPAATMSTFALPRWGISKELAGELMEGAAASGHYIDNPHCAVGAAAVYFLFLGLAELLLLSWIDPARLIP